MREVAWLAAWGWGYPLDLRVGKNVFISPTVTFVYKDPKDIIEIGDDSIIRSGCVLYYGVKLGKKVALGHNTILLRNTVIGDHTYLGGSVVCEGDTTIGHHCGINAQCHITRFTQIGNYVFFGASVTTSNDKAMLFRREGHGLDLKAPIIHDGVRIGNQAYIMAGVEIGERAVIGAGAVVIKNVPSLAVMLGVPAHISRYRSETEEPIIPCKECF